MLSQIKEQMQQNFQYSTLRPQFFLLCHYLDCLTPGAPLFFPKKLHMSYWLSWMLLATLTFRKRNSRD